MAPNLFVLNTARALQAIGVCAGIIAARAIVRDLHEPQKGAALLAKSLALMGVIAMTCPPLGGLLQGWFGWSGAFWAMSFYALVVYLFTFFNLPETLLAKNQQSLDLKTLFANYRAIIRNREFLLYCSVATSAYAALMCFFMKSPIVFIKEFGLLPWQFGLALSLCTCGFITGTLIGRKLVT